MARMSVENSRVVQKGRSRRSRSGQRSGKLKIPSKDHTMDKLVRQVTVVQGSGPARSAKVVYHEKQQDYPTFPMDDIVKRITVIRGKGRTRQVQVIFNSPYWADRDDSWQSFEQGVRRFLKADMIRAQEAYRRHVESARDAKKTWWLDISTNFARSIIEAEKSTRKDTDKETKKDTARGIKSEIKGA
jgi:hypothetical protein